jgi:hypothetical protein
VKAAFAILFSLLLALTQSVLPAKADGQAQSASCCKRCACESPCCVNGSAPISAPAPAVPVPSASIKQFQPALAMLAKLFVAPVSSASTISFPAQFSLHSCAVPIYDRNCTYLI